MARGEIAAGLSAYAARGQVRFLDNREEALAAAFDKGGVEWVTRLYRGDDLPEEDCWLRAPGWCLAYR